MWLLCHTLIGIVLSLEGCERSQLPLAEVEMGSHGLPKSHSKLTTKLQYEGCRGGLTSSNVPMEENPAYQSVESRGLYFADLQFSCFSRF